jgi:CoA:oxalate CoA-transferase
MSILENAVARYFVTKESPKPMGNRHSTIVPFETFDAKDNKIMIAVANNNLWKCFCEGIEREDLVNHEKFMTNQLRLSNYDELKPILDEELKKKNAEHWNRIFNEIGVPCSPICNIEMAVNNEQLISRNMIQTIDHKKAGKIQVTGIPIKISGCSDEVKHPAPILGEHTEEILRQYLNINDSEYQNLVNNNIV